MEPWILSALAAWGIRARELGIKITVENGHRAGWAWRFGLGEYLDLAPELELTAHEETGRFLALRTVRTPEEHGQLIGDVIPMLHLVDEPEQARAVQYVLSELMRNVREHSKSEHGAVVCAQYYSKAKRPYLSVGVADTGVGLSATLSSYYPEASEDAVAVRLAVQPGVSGVAGGLYGSNNAGAGLFYTRRLAEVSDRYFAIGSGGAMFRSSAATATPRPDDTALVFPISNYPGTMVSVGFSLEDDVDWEDFLKVTGAAFTRMDEEVRQAVATRVRFT
jgi:hypothetical protein